MRKKDGFSFQKIKRDNKGHIILEYSQIIEGKTAEHISKFDEEPAPEFSAAFGRLGKIACHMLELDADLAARFTPRTVAYSFDGDDRLQAIIICEYHMPNSGATVMVETPLYKAPLDEKEAARPGYFSQSAVQALWDLAHEASRYLKGHRAQMSLFDDEAEPAPPDRVAPGLAFFRRSRTDFCSHVSRDDREKGGGRHGAATKAGN